MGRFSYIYLPSFKAYANIGGNHGIFLSLLIATQALNFIDSSRLIPITHYQLPITNYPLPITHYQLPQKLLN
ncbi:hypothetical protein NIES37_50920 [Tolypothrix tenuis PCC 7101]|uniref:Uncharacterized protein n=1 Tax=Tolypothrix tenuis PCC 7101 TaxID=231146 RepID=A0A1Z4N5W0_9CYAN|nr:hypothetical protein [Aulosira sp. FACHB-113]BAZ01094.1 hypothetical protein NIES37_50920 [Tolypothrix tenuis PCC 7101]BAZ74984.1 hypothetical protein NIES50_35640 [Aulosira laxa NIES-50]